VLDLFTGHAVVSNGMEHPGFPLFAWAHSQPAGGVKAIQIPNPPKRPSQDETRPAPLRLGSCMSVLLVTGFATHSSLRDARTGFSLKMRSPWLLAPCEPPTLVEARVFLHNSSQVMGPRCPIERYNASGATATPLGGVRARRAGPAAEQVRGRGGPPLQARAAAGHPGALAGHWQPLPPGATLPPLPGPTAAAPPRPRRVLCGAERVRGVRVSPRSDGDTPLSRDRVGAAPTLEVTPRPVRRPASFFIGDPQSSVKGVYELSRQRGWRKGSPPQRYPAPAAFLRSRPGRGGGVKNRPRPDLCFPLCSSFRYGVSAVEFVQPSDWKERLGVDRVIHLVVPDYSAPPGPSMQEGGWAEALPQGGSSGSGPRGKSG